MSCWLFSVANRKLSRASRHVKYFQYHFISFLDSQQQFLWKKYEQWRILHFNFLCFLWIFEGLKLRLRDAIITS